MRYLSVCSGIGAASVAWGPLGWQAVAFSEIEPFPCAVLDYHYPDVPNLGDMTKFLEWPDADFDLLCGGTPCQSFSVAGLRKGLADPRGNLMLTFGAIAAKYRPRWLVWENVPGVLSSNGGRDFGTFLGMLAQLGYGFAYRILDAQYFGVPQRRCRVFVVGYLGDWRRAAAVLFERHSMSGDSPPCRKARQTAPTTPARSTGGACAPCLAFPAHMSFVNVSENVAPTLLATYPIAVATQGDVRRLTPRECERLMGFPDDYTRIPWRGKPASECPDAPRYKALGNSWAVPVVRWIGERINAVVEQIEHEVNHPTPK